MNLSKNNKEVELNDVVFLFNDGKHVVESFTKTAIRFVHVTTNKSQTINKNTFLKKHVYSNDKWHLMRKIRTVNMDFI